MWSIKSLNEGPFKFSENLLEIKSVNSGNLTAALSALSIVPDENFFDRIHHLQLTKCTVIGSDFLEFLRQTPNLKELNLIGVKVGKCGGRICDPIELKLTDLGLEHGSPSTDWMFEHLHCTKVSNHLKIRNVLKTSWNSESLVMFLSRLQGNVNYLQLIDINLDNLVHPVHPILPAFNFSWRFLHVETFGLKKNHVTENYRVMKQLLAMAMEKESCLKIGSVTNKFKARSAIQILKFYTGSEIELLGEWNQKKNVSSGGKYGLIKDLTLRNISPNPIDNTNLIVMFPKVKRLQLQFYSIELLNKLNMLSIAANLQDVETLVIDWISEYKSTDKLLCFLEQFKGIKFPKLTSIELGPMGILFAVNSNEITPVEVMISNFARRHEKLTSIKFFGVNPSASDDLLQSITNAVKGSKVSEVEVADLKNMYTNEVGGGRLLGKELIGEYLELVEQRQVGQDTADAINSKFS